MLAFTGVQDVDLTPTLVMWGITASLKTAIASQSSKGQHALHYRYSNIAKFSLDIYCLGCIHKNVGGMAEVIWRDGQVTQYLWHIFSLPDVISNHWYVTNNSKNIGRQYVNHFDIQGLPEIFIPCLRKNIKNINI